MRSVAVLNYCVLSDCGLHNQMIIEKKLAFYIKLVILFTDISLR